MEAQQDFRELLELLNVRSVEYVIVGAHALAFYGAPRYTGDLDVYVRPTAENAHRLMGALADFGFGSSGISEEDFLHPDRVVQLGYPPVRIDLLTSVSGVSWEDVWENRAGGQYGDVPVNYIGRDQFVLNKLAVARKKDLADLEALGED